MSNFGVMFHHFHDEDKHIKSQGSISSDELRKMIEFLQKDHEILNADDWYSGAINKSLTPNQICLTFDDALACQYDIAYPVLCEMGIKAFWFVYTSIFEGALERLEIYRHFRFSSFSSVNDFYAAFFDIAAASSKDLGLDMEQEIRDFNPKSYLTNFTFYTDEDKLFRFLRDYILGPENYFKIMDDMLSSYNYSIDENLPLLWINKNQVREVAGGGIVGLHSHTHPTLMSQKIYNDQLSEYRENKRIIEVITDKRVLAVSYPCNSFNSDTDRIMQELGICLGFNATMDDLSGNILHLPRRDHAYIAKEMGL